MLIVLDYRVVPPTNVEGSGYCTPDPLTFDPFLPPMDTLTVLTATVTQFQRLRRQNKSILVSYEFPYRSDSEIMAHVLGKCLNVIQ